MKRFAEHPDGPLFFRAARVLSFLPILLRVALLCGCGKKDAAGELKVNTYKYFKQVEEAEK